MYSVWLLAGKWGCTMTGKILAAQGKVHPLADPPRLSACRPTGWSNHSFRLQTWKCHEDFLSCGYNNFIDHPPVITIDSWDSNHSQMGSLLLYITVIVINPHYTDVWVQNVMLLTASPPPNGLSFFQAVITIEWEARVTVDSPEGTVPWSCRIRRDRTIHRVRHFLGVGLSIDEECLQKMILGTTLNVNNSFRSKMSRYVKLFFEFFFFTDDTWSHVSYICSFCIWNVLWYSSRDWSQRAQRQTTGLLSDAVATAHVVPQWSVFREWLVPTASLLIPPLRIWYLFGCRSQMTTARFA